MDKNEDDLYAKSLFEDILSNSNLSVIKSSKWKNLKSGILKMKKILSENQNLSLNQILYGPPGDWETYHTIDKALEILAEVENIQIPSQDNRNNRKKLFDEYVEKGQIIFTTFHQSYGYEEFVEGVKPIINDESNSKEVQYEISDGVFKELCDKALKKFTYTNEREKIIIPKIRIMLEKAVEHILEHSEHINFLRNDKNFSTEKEVTLHTTLSNHEIMGRIDSIIFSQENNKKYYSIIDYKTGGFSFNINKLKDNE